MSFAAKVATATCLICVTACAAMSAAAQTATPNTAAARTAPAPSGGAASARWLHDPRTGCSVSNPDFAQGDAIVWAGACANGMVDGPGTLTVLDKGQPQVTVGATFRNGDLQPGRASFAWPDGSKYDGAQSGAKFNGQGVFVSARNDRLEGEWKDGALAGHAIVAWANGNRYEGGWLNGKPEGRGVEIWANGDRYDGDWDAGVAQGHGMQVWANGQTYDGEWRNDRPNGTGRLVRPDGTIVTGNFVDGIPQGVADTKTAPPAPGLAAGTAPDGGPASATAPAAVAPANVAPAVAASTIADARPAAWRGRLGDVEGKKLIAVDGSIFTLSESEGGFTRLIARSDGASITTAFTFANERMGTVADAGYPAHVTGLFKMTDAEIDVDYSDGRSETMRAGTGGLALALHTPDGQTVCTSWYPDGHSFGDAERKAALAAYANRLGVKLKAAGTQSTVHSGACNPPAAPIAAKAASGRPRNTTHPLAQALPASFESRGEPAGPAHSSTPQPIVVRTSEVHPIDAPKPEILAFAGGQSSSAATPAAPVSAIAPVPAPAAVVAAAPPLPATPASVTPAPPASPAQAASAQAASGAVSAASATPAPAAYQPDTTDSGASSCLSVGSDGAHWGFRNSCHFSVQFVYCLKDDGDVLASCKDGAVPGSAAPDSFSALVADASLKERNVDHQFRWVACNGGAGEVIPKLDGIDPPTGRCLRARTAER